jgi:hypothetical protein
VVVVLPNTFFLFFHFSFLLESNISLDIISAFFCCKNLTLYGLEIQVTFSNNKELRKQIHHSNERNYCVDEHLEARQSVLLIQRYHVQQTGQSEHVDHSRNGTSKSAIITRI